MFVVNITLSSVSHQIDIRLHSYRGASQRLNYAFQMHQRMKHMRHLLTSNMNFCVDYYNCIHSDRSNFNTIDALSSAQIQLIDRLVAYRHDIYISQCFLSPVHT
jgi:hypothetical protein